MALNIKTKLGSLENYLIKNNTTTSSLDISGSLNVRVQQFYKGTDGMSQSQPVPSTLYPVVFVELVRKEESHDTLGNSARKRTIIITYNIIPCVSYGPGQVDQRESSNLELIQLAQNIEAALRYDASLSLTADRFSVTNSEYGTRYNQDSTYVSVAKITCEAKYYNQS